MVMFLCPVDYPRVTSKFGMRTHPIKKVKELHGGVDLVGTGSIRKVPIYAAASGTVRVVKDSGNSGYGRYVIITHNINGVKYETNYAHLDSWQVKVGQVVKQGQQIGIMGTTGSSTGVHLHFEIHKGTYSYDSGKFKNALDPLKHIDLKVSPATLVSAAKQKEEEEMTIKALEKKVVALEKEVQGLRSELANKAVREDGEVVSAWHTSDMAWMVDNGIYKGDESGNLNPGGALTREAAAAVIRRTLTGDVLIKAILNNPSAVEKLAEQLKTKIK